MKETGMASLSKISINFIWGKPTSIMNCNKPFGPLEHRS